MRMHPLTAVGLFCFLLTGCEMSPDMKQAQRDLRVADVELASGATAAALQIAGRVVAEHPNDVEALVRLARAQSAVGESASAENSLHRALRNNPDSRDVRLSLARLHLKSDPAEAARDLNELSRQSPNDPTILTDYGVADDLLAHHAEAQAFYRRALAVSPELVSAQVDLGLSLALSNHSNEALTLLGPLAQSPDASPKVRQDYAIAVALAGRMGDAQAILEQDLPAQQVTLALGAFKDLQGSQR